MLAAMARAAAAVLLAMAAVRLAAVDLPLHAHPYADAVPLAEWRFAWDGDDAGADEGWFEPGFDRSSWRPVAVPGVWDRPPGAVEVPARTGVGWFATTITVPEGWRGRPVLVCLGAMYVTDAWCDGRYLGVHRGGYTPFSLELGDLAPGTRATIVLRVDNRLDRETVPSRHLGWQPYGGLTRACYLAERPRVWLDAVATATALGEDGAVSFTVSGALRNDTGAAVDGPLAVRLEAGGRPIDEATLPVAAAAGEAAAWEHAFELHRPRLWHVDDPFRHELVLRWRHDGAERRMAFPVGLRTVRVAGGRFLLNDRELWLQGFGVHEERPGVGPCLDAELLERELRLMRDEYGANAIRPGHYPNHPLLYELCDRLGILVFTEIPAWQIDRDFLRTDHAWEDWIVPQLDEMIAAYRNHACVASWSVQNEIGGAMDYNRRAVRHVVGRDPHRLPMAVVAATVSLELYGLLPLGGRNFHYGWYHSKRPYGLRAGLRENLAAAGGTPIWVAELGAHAIRGRHAAYNQHARGSETYQDKVVRYGFQYCAAHEEVVGISPWSWRDFHRGGHVEPHGLLDRHGEPKLVAYAVRNLMAGDHRLLVYERESTLEPGEPFRAALAAFAPTRRSGGPFTARWQIVAGDRRLAHGEERYELDGRRVVPVAEIAWEPPAEARGHHTLWVEVADAGGAHVFTNACHFGIGDPDPPGVLRLRCTRDGAPAAALARWRDLRLPVYRHPGLLVALPPGEHVLRIDAGGATVERTVRLEAGAETAVEVALP